MNQDNPFKLSSYYGPKYFCDREKETEQLIQYAKNGINVTLFSLRRMGKTGLLHHLFYHLKQEKECYPIYVDIYDTEDLQGFTNKLASAILDAFPERQSIGKRFLSFLKTLSPTISYDPYTGVPEVSLHIANEQQRQHTLSGLFQFLEEQNIPALVAIDEFQQITSYPEKNVEAVLRTAIQTLKQTRFIFSGSQQHLLIEMFEHQKRPFFASTSPMYLDKINSDDYATFISKHFNQHKKPIDQAAIEYVLDCSKRHTYYTQSLCNKAFQMPTKKIDLKTVKEAFHDLLMEQEPVFFQYRNLLSDAQWSLLVAIAKEDEVKQPMAAHFIQKYTLGSPATVRRSLEALMHKEMIYKITDPQGGNTYQLYQCFFSRWLALKF